MESYQECNKCGLTEKIYPLNNGTCSRCLAGHVAGDASTGGRMISARRPIPKPDPRIHSIVPGNDGYAGVYRHLRIIVSEGLEDDGRWWLHASVSREDRKMPTYHDLKTLKAICIGPERKAVQVFAPESEHMDIAGKGKRPLQVLHLWSPEDANFLPDFTRGGQGL